MDLKKLADKDLLLSTERAAVAEKAATTQLLHHLAEVDRRRLFARQGYASLFEYCVKGLAMSEPQAARRVNAARAMAAFPEIESGLQSGALSLTNVSQAQVFFRKEKALSTEEKREVLQLLENESARSAERILTEISSDPAKIPKEKTRPLKENLTELRVVVDAATMDDLERLKELLPAASLAELLQKMARLCREKLDPLEKKARTPAPERKQLAPLSGKGPPRGRERRSRYIPASVRLEVWKRDQGRCGYQDPESGRTCGSRHRLQLDHIQPFAKGGENVAANLRLLCPAHNQWHALEEFGEKVQRHLKPNGPSG